jgi:hypothetical protein
MAIAIVPFVQKPDKVNWYFSMNGGISEPNWIALGFDLTFEYASCYILLTPITVSSSIIRS